LDSIICMNEILSDIEKNVIDAMRADEWDKVLEAVNVAKEESNIKRAESDLKTRKEAIDQRIALLTGKPEATKGFSGRQTKLKITDGCVRYNYLLVRRGLEDGVLSFGESLTIYVPVTGEKFSTRVYSRNKILKERHAIGRFYDAA